MSMTREEAIARIKDHIERHRIGEYPHIKLAEALDMALSALRPVSREQVIAERGALIEDFVDYVTGGVPNPAIFCKNRCDKCTDMRGWCTGKDCKGFYPSGASGQKED